MASTAPGCAGLQLDGKPALQSQKGANSSTGVYIKSNGKYPMISTTTWHRTSIINIFLKLYKPSECTQWRRYRVRIHTPSRLPTAATFMAARMEFTHPLVRGANTNRSIAHRRRNDTQQSECNRVPHAALQIGCADVHTPKPRRKLAQPHSQYHANSAVVSLQVDCVCIIRFIGAAFEMIGYPRAAHRLALICRHILHVGFIRKNLNESIVCFRPDRHSLLSCITWRRNHPFRYQVTRDYDL